MSARSGAGGRLAAPASCIIRCPWQNETALTREVVAMLSGRPSEWSRDERDRPLTREALWYELDALRRSIDTKLSLLGRKGERAARFPESGWERDLHRTARMAAAILFAVSWTAIVVIITIASTR